MRLIENIVIILLFLLAIQTFLPSVLGRFDRKLLMGWLSVVAAVSIPIHALFEGLRWQMIPVYLLTVLLLIRGMFQLKDIYKIEPSAPLKAPPRRRVVAAIIVLTIVASSSTLLLDSLLPVIVLPNPTGEYNVGTVTFELTDQNRNETFTTDPDDFRRILVQAWYPTDDVTGLNRAPYMYNPSTFSTGIQQGWGLPSIY